VCWRTDPTLLGWIVFFQNILWIVLIRGMRSWWASLSFPLRGMTRHWKSRKEVKKRCGKGMGRVDVGLPCDYQVYKVYK